MANEVIVNVNANTAGAKSKLQDFSKAARTTGIALTAMGAGGVLAIKGFVDAALVQNKALETTRNSVENTGVAWDSVKDKIMAATAALQKKTNFGDEEQLKALQIMIPILGDVDQAMAALPLVLDASAASGKSLETVSNTLTRALSGSVNTATSLGISFDKDATFAERLALGMSGVGGAAAAQADPLIQMSNALGDLKETIGNALLPIITPLIEKVTSLAEWVQTLNPNIVRAAAIVGALTTAFAVVAGPILILLSMIPAIVAGFGAITASITVLMGATGIGLIVIGIAALALAWKTNFGGIQEKTEFVFGKIKEVFNSKLGWILPGGALIKGILLLKDNWGSIWNGIKDFTSMIFDKIKGFFSDLIKWVVEKLDVLIDAYNAVATKLGFDAIPTMQEMMNTVGDMGEKMKGLTEDVMDSVDAFIKLGVEQNKIEQGSGANQLGFSSPNLPQLPSVGGGGGAGGGGGGTGGGGGGRGGGGGARGWGRTEFTQQEMAPGLLGRWGVTADMYSRMTEAERLSASKAYYEFERGAGNLFFIDGVAASVDSTEGAEAVNSFALGTESDFGA